VAGMDGNRTHPGRVIGAPQTVLKTAGLVSTTVQVRPLPFRHQPPQSVVDGHRLQSSAGLAVFLAVRELCSVASHIAFRRWYQYKWA